MLTSRRIISWGLTLVLGCVVGSHGMAKGLSELSQSNPANDDDKSAKADGDEEGQKAANGAGVEDQGAAAKQGAASDQKPIASLEKSAMSKAVAGRLAIGTSYGWILGSRTTGKWSAKGGMSDVTIGYKWRTLGKAYDLVGTYRYAPMSVHGEQDSQSYRGIWEVHYFGGKLARQVKNILTFGTLEMGYVISHVLPTDGLPEKSSAQKGGYSLSFGGGADFKFLDQVYVGPRLHVGMGSIRTVQLAGAASFVF